jgi:hypothetical protein
LSARQRHGRSERKQRNQEASEDSRHKVPHARYNS